MKVQNFTQLAVLMADQVASRRRADEVPAALAALAERVGPRMVLAYERTAGDELQGLTDSPRAVVEAVVLLTRLGGWRVGIGLGAVERPLPVSTREARGEAYVAGRKALEAARQSPTGLAVRSRGVSAPGYGDQVITDAETVLFLVRSVVSRRTPEGWQLMDLLDANANSRQAAHMLGVTPSAISQRLARSGREEAQRGADLATRLLAQAMGAHA